MLYTKYTNLVKLKYNTLPPYVTALIIVLANCHQIAAKCHHIIVTYYYVTRGLYIALSGATTLLLSFSLALDPYL